MAEQITAEQMLQNHESTIQTLRNDVNILNNKLATLDEKLTLLVKTVGKGPSPKAKLPDTDKFTGANFSFETWLPSITAKLRIDGKAIGNAEAQFFYIYSRLDGKIQALVMPQLIQSSESGTFNPQELLDQLARIFDDPNKVQQAENALLALQQNDDTFGIFIAKFERLLYKSKANTWSEPAKISMLRQALNKETRKRALQIRPQPSTYTDYVDKLKEVLGSIHYSGKQGGHGHNKDAMEIDAIHAQLNAVGSIDLGGGCTLQAYNSDDDDAIVVPSREALPPASKTTAPAASASTSSSRARLHTIAALHDDDSNDDNDDDGNTTDSDEDFARTLERRYYGR